MQYLIWDIVSKLKLIYIYIANDSKLRLLCHLKKGRVLVPILEIKNMS